MPDHSIAYVASGQLERIQNTIDNTDGGGSDRPTRHSKLCLSGEDVVALASLLAISLGKDKTRRDLETLINLLSMTTSNLRSMLSQRTINRGANIEIIE